jgi:predicted PurR-regulated permease PerM
MLESIRKETPEEELPRPDIKKSFALRGLFLLACFYTLYFGRAFFLPIVLSLLLNFLLGPVVRGLKKIHIPEALGAGLVILSLLGLLGLGIFELATPAYDWIGQAPQSLRKVESRIRDLKKPVQTMSKATEQVE